MMSVRSGGRPHNRQVHRPCPSRTIQSSTLFDTSPRHHVYYRYEFPGPPRVCGHAQDRSQNSQPQLQFAYPLPYGAVLRDGGVQFVVYSRSATAMRVLLYERVTDREPTAIDRVQSARPTAGATSGACSCPASRPANFTIFRPRARSIPARANASSPHARLIDPYARGAGRPVPASADGIDPPAQVRGGRRHVRLERRPPSQAPPVRNDHLRDARPRLHAQQHQRRRASRHVRGRHRKDSVLEVAGRHGGRADAGARVSHRRGRRREARRAATTGATTRWRSSRRTAATWQATSRATRSGSSRRWSASCTRPASK